MDVKRQATASRRQRAVNRQNSLALGVADSPHPQHFPGSSVLQEQEIIH